MTSTREHYLYPGTLFANNLPFVVTTVLGSCVAVCLWDPELKIGGINHFQLALWNGNGLASPKFGNIAIKKLIDKMIKLGSQKQNLKAKVFGGAAVLQGSNGGVSVGTKNILIAKDNLNDEGICIVSSDIGGNQGRKLKFNTGTGVVMMKRLQGNGANATINER